MASAEVSEVFPCSVEQFYKIVTDYEKYPEFLQEVKEIKILKTEANKKLIEYKVSVMKDFKYSLWMTETSNLITWEFASGDIFKTMKGFWKLQDENGKCRASYGLDATFGMLVPSPIAKALVSVNLPNMISSYQKRVAEIYGR